MTSKHSPSALTFIHTVLRITGVSYGRGRTDIGITTTGVLLF